MVTAEKVDIVMMTVRAVAEVTVVGETVVEAETTEQNYFLIDHASFEDNTGHCY